MNPLEYRVRIGWLYRLKNDPTFVVIVKSINPLRALIRYAHFKDHGNDDLYDCNTMEFFQEFERYEKEEMN